MLFIFKFSFTFPKRIFYTIYFWNVFEMSEVPRMGHMSPFTPSLLGCLIYICFSYNFVLIGTRTHFCILVYLFAITYNIHRTQDVPIKYNIHRTTFTIFILSDLLLNTIETTAQGFSSGEFVVEPCVYIDRN